MAKMFYWLCKRPYQEWNCFSLTSKAPVYFTFSSIRQNLKGKGEIRRFLVTSIFSISLVGIAILQEFRSKQQMFSAKNDFLITIFQVPISYCGIMPIWRNRDATQKWLKNQLQQNLFSLEILAKLTSRDMLIQYNKILIIV